MTRIHISGGMKIMIDVKKVREYIEKKYDVILTPIQYQLLKAVVRGDKVYTPRQMGRSLVYNGYADYLVNVLGKSTDYSIAPEDFDTVITSTTLTKDPLYKDEGYISMMTKLLSYMDKKTMKKEFDCICDGSKDESN